MNFNKNKRFQKTQLSHTTDVMFCFIDLFFSFATTNNLKNKSQTWYYSSSEKYPYVDQNVYLATENITSHLAFCTLNYWFKFKK